MIAVSMPRTESKTPKRLSSRKTPTTAVKPTYLIRSRRSRLIAWSSETTCTEKTTYHQRALEATRRRLCLLSAGQLATGWRGPRAPGLGRQTRPARRRGHSDSRKPGVRRPAAGRVKRWALSRIAGQLGSADDQFGTAPRTGSAGGARPVAYCRPALWMRIPAAFSSGSRVAASAGLGAVLGKANGLLGHGQYTSQSPPGTPAPPCD